jgi:signal transduction histidine kinase
MKLLNRTLAYFSLALLLILGIWAALFYMEMLDEVYDSLDDGLDNYKTVIVQKAQTDTMLLHKELFAESNYLVREVTAQEALNAKDVHKDTLMYMQNEADYEPVRLLTTVFELNGKYYELKVISSMVEEDDLIEDLLYSLMWLYLALVVVIILVNNILLRRIWRPFYQTIEQIKKFRLGKENTFSPEPTNTIEFKVLNQAIEAFINNSIETYNSQKQFIENASHEMQTPVAISINKLELLAENLSNDEESLQQIEGVLQNLERLSRLNKALLLLTKIENKQFTNDNPVDLPAIVAKLANDFEDFAEYKEVSIAVVAEAVLKPVLNTDLAEILVANLIKNAIVHNIAKGRVEVEIRGSQLVIANTGTSVALDSKKIFNRFVKQSDHKGNTGLGLAIVKAITDLYNLDITYRFSEDIHTMSVDFKNVLK